MTSGRLGYSARAGSHEKNARVISLYVVFSLTTRQLQLDYETALHRQRNATAEAGSSAPPLARPTSDGTAGGTLLVCAANEIAAWEEQLRQAHVPFICHHGKSKFKGGVAGRWHGDRVVLTTYGMLAAKDTALPHTSEDGWRTKRSAVPADARQPRSQLHLHRWRRAIFADAECALNPTTQRAAAALALRVDVRWALLACETDEDAAYRLDEMGRKEQLGLLRLLGLEADDAASALRARAIERLVRGAGAFDLELES